MRRACLILALALPLGCAMDTPRANPRLGTASRRPPAWARESRPLSDDARRLAHDVGEALRPARIPRSDLDRSLRLAERELAHDAVRLPDPEPPARPRDGVLGFDDRIWGFEGEPATIVRDIGRLFRELPGDVLAIRDYVDRVVLLRSWPKGPLERR